MEMILKKRKKGRLVIVSWRNICGGFIPASRKATRCEGWFQRSQLGSVQLID